MGVGCAWMVSPARLDALDEHRVRQRAESELMEKSSPHGDVVWGGPTLEQQHDQRDHLRTTTMTKLVMMQVVATRVMAEGGEGGVAPRVG